MTHENYRSPEGRGNDAATPPLTDDVNWAAIGAILEQAAREVEAEEAAAAQAGEEGER